jgi:hypothetical protein
LSFFPAPVGVPVGAGCQPLVALPSKVRTASNLAASGESLVNSTKRASGPCGPVRAGVPGSPKVQMSVIRKKNPKKATAPIR